ncbi:DUF92 domain-containing protein [Paenibacillus sp. N3/727]|uniref:DUF92 domain-containing protein n=1 Tax=Paenibacillus sp. N3/727 TaxID=2925845 RepID=UPI001F52C2A3|nr:DUF92 domain-containing protein [Paenibacillus sp. N3/727]UNK17092.1 DUF92 domain-containing protein [Paenibacillus sp. N3/727]
MNWLIGAMGALIVAGAAYLKKSLSLSGAAAAVMMGTVYYGAGNLFWFGTLLLFFMTSTLLSKYRQGSKQDLEKSYAKTGKRDAGQVFANGGIGMVLCLLHFMYPHEAWKLLFIGVMAAVTADTWATEIGSLSRRPPRSILNGKSLPPGTSGGVSWLGSTAAALGGAIIGAGAWLFGVWSGLVPDLITYAIAGLIGGLVGAFTDSWMGATVQKMYRCTTCGKDVEVHRHCGQPTERSGGWDWMTNDAVNLISSLIGGFAAWVAAAFL